MPCGDCALRAGSTASQQWRGADVLSHRRAWLTARSQFGLRCGAVARELPPLGPQRNTKSADMQTDPLAYTAQPFDDETHLLYLGARYHHVKIGRFYQMDPVHFTEDNSHSFNRFAYANNNPYRFVDPTGSYGELPLEALSIGLGANSFQSNIRQGNYLAAIVDALGVGLDFGAGLVPGVPGVVGASIAAARGMGSNYETFYRAMSKTDYQMLLGTGKLPATSETFISSSREYVEKYDGVVVEFQMRPGTTQALEKIGVRDGSKLVEGAYPNMPHVTAAQKWKKHNAYFKGETKETINIGLGEGKALDTFNDNIGSFNAIRDE